MLALSGPAKLGAQSPPRESPAAEPPSVAGPAAADTGAADAPSAAAAYDFAIAKMLAEGGSLAAAREAFTRAEKLTPDDPYLLVEHAELLQRMASRARLAPVERTALLDDALLRAERAAKLAPRSVDVLRALAQIYLASADSRAGALDRATETLETLRELAPWDLQAMIPLGQVYLQGGDAERAAEVFTEVAAYAPDIPFVFQMLAEASRQAGRLEQTEDALERLLALDPSATDSRLTLARLYARRGDFARAAEVLGEVPPEHLQDPQIQGELAWQFHRSGEHEKALAAAETVLARDPEDRWLRLVQALALGELGRTEEALTILGGLRAEDPDNLELLRATARVLESAGRSPEAARLYRDLIERLGSDSAAQPLRDRARLLLAGVYARAGDGESALAVLEPLIASPEQDLARDAALALADLLHEAGRTDEALEILREGTAPELQAKELDLLLAAGREEMAQRSAESLAAGTDPDVLLAAAQAAQRREAYALSVPLLERALESRPDDIQLLFLLGAGRERTGRAEEAATAFQQLLAQSPDFAPALNYLGYMWAERGENLSEAIELVHRAVDLEPDNGAYLDSLGWAYFQRGDLSEAREFLERAVELMPADPTVLEHLADVFVALGEVGSARDLYRRALDVREESPATGGSDAPTIAELQRKLDELR